MTACNALLRAQPLDSISLFPLVQGERVRGVDRSAEKKIMVSGWHDSPTVEDRSNSDGRGVVLACSAICAGRSCGMEKEGVSDDSDDDLQSVGSQGCLIS